MKLRISGLLVIPAFALVGVLGSVQSLAQNAYLTSLDTVVSVIDTATNTPITIINVGPNFSTGVGGHPGRQHSLCRGFCPQRRIRQHLGDRYGHQ
jgi:hypothetical protein